jgi:hypothetical protein
MYGRMNIIAKSKIIRYKNALSVSTTAENKRRKASITVNIERAISKQKEIKLRFKAHLRKDYPRDRNY